MIYEYIEKSVSPKKRKEKEKKERKNRKKGTENDWPDPILAQTLICGLVKRLF